MANLFERVGSWMARNIASYLDPEYIAVLVENKKYYEGDQRKPLKTKSGQMDDNLIVNFIRLVVDRSVSMLYSGGVEITASTGEDSAEQAYIDAVLAANHADILFFRTGLDGAVSGTPYWKIIPDYYDGGVARIVLLDPECMSVETDPLDIERVVRYVYEKRLTDKEAVREITRRSVEGEADNTWIVERWEKKGSQAWALIESIPWPYPFPPIKHWQNLPSIHDSLGVADIEGANAVQDRFNFITSNISKIIRYHAHPKTWGSGLPANSALEKASWGADEMIRISSETGKIQNLEMQSDLSSSLIYAQTLRQQIFDLCRVVDISSMSDKLGALTNFGLRVLYTDMLNKNNTKRQLYGEAFEDVFTRILVLKGMESTNVQIEWGEDLPANETESAAIILQDLAAGLVSKQSASELRGYQWLTNEYDQGEKDIIGAEAAGNSSLENAALTRFLTGQETPGA